MIVDLGETRDSELAEYDVCVVGSGPAGTTVANELAGSGVRICILESGRLKPTKHGDRLRDVRSEGIQIKPYSRERVLGGASTTWAGLSSLLDSVDLKPRPYVPNSGWPIAREELLPFYEEAAVRYRFPPLPLLAGDELRKLWEKGDTRPTWRNVEEKLFLAAAEPQNFAREFRDLFESDQVDVYLDATLLELEQETDTSRVNKARLRTSDGRELWLRARVFVLATGGLENARLLLNSGGLGNEDDVVGRYLMNHPKNYHGILKLARPVRELPYYFGCLYQGFAGYAGLRLREDLQEERALLNSYVRFEPLFPWSDRQGVEAFVFLAKQMLQLLRRVRRLGKGKGKLVQLRDYSETGDDSDLQNERKSTLQWLGLVGRIVIDLPWVIWYLFFRVFMKRGPAISRVRMRNFMEMEPHPENRVLLDDAHDANGQPIPLVRHRCSELDRRSMVALHEEMVQEVAKNGLGKLTTDLQRQEPWPIDQDASHHLGTTRMGTDPRTSVVNPDCRLHDVDNVYLAGGSVFPTSGCANPTFTIVALAIRLAGHLRQTLDGARPDR